MEIRESRALPEGLDEPALEPFLTTLVARLAPGLESSVAYLPFGTEAQSGTNFSAAGHLEDGTLIVVAVQPAERSLTLLVTDASHLKLAPSFVGRWTYLGFAGVVTLGFAAGTWIDSAVWGTLVSVSLLVGWVALELGRQTRKQALSRVRPLDVESWRARLDAAVAAARVEVLR